MLKKKEKQSQTSLAVNPFYGSQEYISQDTPVTHFKKIGDYSQRWKDPYFWNNTQPTLPARLASG